MGGERSLNPSVLFSLAGLFCLFIHFHSEQRFQTGSHWICSLYLLPQQRQWIVSTYHQLTTFLYPPISSYVVMSVFSYHIYAASDHQFLGGILCSIAISCSYSLILLGVGFGNMIFVKIFVLTLILWYVIIVYLSVSVQWLHCIFVSVLMLFLLLCWFTNLSDFLLNIFFVHNILAKATSTMKLIRCPFAERAFGRKILQVVTLGEVLAKVVIRS